MIAGFGGTNKNDSANLANDKLWSHNEDKPKKSKFDDQEEKLFKMLEQYENTSEKYSKYLA